VQNNLPILLLDPRSDIQGISFLILRRKFILFLIWIKGMILSWKKGVIHKRFVFTEGQYHSLLASQISINYKYLCSLQLLSPICQWYFSFASLISQFTPRNSSPRMSGGDVCIFSWWWVLTTNLTTTDKGTTTLDYITSKVNFLVLWRINLKTCVVSLSLFCRFCFHQRKSEFVIWGESPCRQKKNKTIMPGVLPGADTIFTTTDDENHAACRKLIRGPWLVTTLNLWFVWESKYIGLTMLALIVTVTWLYY